MTQTDSANYSFLRKLQEHVSASTVLVVCTILALICANVPFIQDWYFPFWENAVSLSVGEFNFFSHNGHPMSLGEVVNDFLMAIFFLSVGLEIKREIKSGDLSTREKAMLPIVGACGGMIVPVLIFHMLCPSDPLMQRGLAIPMATDIAFSLGVLSIFSTRVPSGLKVFLAALAVADDLGGIIVIALFYTSRLNTLFLVLSAICVAVMIFACYRKCCSLKFYLFSGLVLWYLMLNSGVHATISGVIVAFCIPAAFEGASSGATVDMKRSPLRILEDSLYLPVGYLVIPLFAFANAGISLAGMDLSTLFSGVGLSVMLGLVLGKFIGVFSFSWIAVRLKIVKLPANTSWKAFASVCVVCGIGFTVSMFIANLSYAGMGPEGEVLLDQAKLGVLVGSVLSAVLGALLLNKTLPQTKDNR